MEKYVPRRIVLKTLNIHYKTLYKLSEQGYFETVKIGNRTLYNSEKFLKENIKNNRICDKW